MNLPILGDLQAEAENRALKVQSMGNQRGSISWFFLEIDHMLCYMHMATRGHQRLRFEDATGTGCRQGERPRA